MLKKIIFILLFFFILAGCSRQGEKINLLDNSNNGAIIDNTKVDKSGLGGSGQESIIKIENGFNN